MDFIVISKITIKQELGDLEENNSFVDIQIKWLINKNDIVIQYQLNLILWEGNLSFAV
jgi:hypothetical protein